MLIHQYIYIKFFLLIDVNLKRNSDVALTQLSLTCNTVEKYFIISPIFSLNFNFYSL